MVPAGGRDPAGRADHSVFWAVWIGIFVTTAGLGIGLSLTGVGSPAQPASETEIESQVSDLASRVWDARIARAKSGFASWAWSTHNWVRWSEDALLALYLFQRPQ